MFAEFISAVFSSWTERVGVVLTILPFLDKLPAIKKWLRGQPILESFRPLLWLVGGVCVFYGFYDAWQVDTQRY